MRVISQDGTLDMPYEEVIIQRFKSRIYFLNKNLTGVESLSDDMQIAEYSTEAKAIKVMEMLRDQYKGLEVFKVLASGTAEHMEKSFNSDELKEYIRAYHDINVFQFPQDDEIEV